MIKLNDRLRRIADEINAGETMADIGTDHGFLPVYLAQRGRCPRVIMTDVSLHSLDKAKATARQSGFLNREHLEDIGARMDFRVGDGLSVLKPAEVDAVVIAGMGGKLIRDILSADMDLTHSMGKYILQPRIGQGLLRKWLSGNGFAIISEGVVREGRHIPEIITAVSLDGNAAQGNLMKRAETAMPDIMQGMRSLEADDIRWKIPPWLIYADGPVDGFLIRNITAEEEKLENVRRARKRDLELEHRILQDIMYLKELRKEYTDGKQR